MSVKPIKINYPEFDLEIDVVYKEELNKITEDAFKDASTARTIKNIRNTLSKGLKAKYGFTDKDKLKEVTTKILEVSGLDENSFDFMDRFSKLIDKNTKLNDVSIDDNSNKNEKTMKGSLKEVELAIDKVIGFDMLYRVMKDLYGKKEAKNLSLDMYDYSLGLSDSSNILVPYCWALDSTKLVTEGRDFGVLPSKPCKNIGSYIGALSETAHQLSSHLAGALALGTLMLDVSHILLYKQRISLYDLKTNVDIRKMIENEFQRLVHSINFLSRNGIESPFTNVSIFDHDKLASLIAEDNYDWYFPKKNKVLSDNNLGGEDLKFSKSEYKEFVLDYIFEVQKIFIDFFDKGDPSNGGMPYRFPVVTLNYSKKIDEKGKLYIDDDNSLLNYMCKKDITRYNNFNSEGSKVCSCCRLISNQEMVEMASSVNSFGGGNVSLGSHRVCTINFARIAYEAESYSDYLEILNDRVDSAAKILKAHKVLLQKLTDIGMHPFISRGWIRLDRMFSTFGVLGIVEAEQILKAKYNHADFDYVKDILINFEKLCSEKAKEQNLLHNIEQIPSESFGVRLASVDKMLFENPYNLDPLYRNQFCGLWDDFTVFEKLKRDGELNSLLSGGGIVHIQCNSNLTASQSKKLIQYACEHGCEHFAINGVYSNCQECRHTEKADFDICPKCQSKNIEKLTRVVGFFVPVSSWNQTRREWEFPRRKFTSLDDFK